MQTIHRILTILLIGFLSACDKEAPSSIPEISFVFECSLLQSEYSSLTIPGQFIKVTRNVHNVPVGYAGLIIGQSYYTDYYAFDAACPVEANRSVSLTISDNGIAECPKCGSKYDLNGGGFPKEGSGLEKKEYLKRYEIFLNGDKLLVRN